MSKEISQIVLLTKVLLLVRGNWRVPCLVEIVEYDIWVGEVGIGLFLTELERSSSIYPPRFTYVDMVH